MGPVGSLARSPSLDISSSIKARMDGPHGWYIATFACIHSDIRWYIYEVFGSLEMPTLQHLHCSLGLVRLSRVHSSRHCTRTATLTCLVDATVCQESKGHRCQLYFQHRSKVHFWTGKHSRFASLALAGCRSPWPSRTLAAHHPFL